MITASSVADVDGWIAQLSECKQLSETDIKKLCEKVGRTPLAHGCPLVNKSHLFFICLLIGT
jgi:hypothetical protein